MSGYSARLTVIKVEMEFQNSKMSRGKVISPYTPPADVRIGVVAGDAIIFKGKLTPSVTLTNSGYVWSGAQSGNGPTIAITFSNACNYAEGLSVLGCPNLGRDGYGNGCSAAGPGRMGHPESDCRCLYNLATEALNWTAANWSAMGGSAAVWNRRADAARHSYWDGSEVVWASEPAGLSPAGGTCPTFTTAPSNSVAGNYTVKAWVSAIPSCCDTATVTILKSDHESGGNNILKDNNTDWTDSGTAYVEPEWVKAPARNNPISHTKNTKVTAKVTVKVEPSGVTFDLIGDVPDGYVDFHKNGNTSTSAGQALTITVDANLPVQVGTFTKSIDWKIKVGATECSAGSSGGHKIYVTYGTPSGSEVTERRVREVCTTADGKSVLQECADAVFDGLSGSFNLGALKWGPSPIWLLHNPGEDSQCPGLAKYVDVHFQMLGLGAGAIRFCRAKPDETYEADASAEGPGTEWRTIVPGTGHPDPTTHDDEYASERLVHVDMDGNANAYEATCFFSGHYYALGVSRDETTPKGVLCDSFHYLGVTLSVEWQYRNGASAPYTFHNCTEDPWVEAP